MEMDIGKEQNINGSSATGAKSQTVYTRYFPPVLR